MVVHSEKTTNATSLIIKGHSHQYMLLSTVCLDVYDISGQCHTLRTSINTGSQANFITDKSANDLKLRRRHASVNITAFGSQESTLIREKMTIRIKPKGLQIPSFNVRVIYCSANNWHDSLNSNHPRILGSHKKPTPCRSFLSTSRFN